MCRYRNSNVAGKSLVCFMQSFGLDCRILPPPPSHLCQNHWEKIKESSLLTSVEPVRSVYELSRDMLVPKARYHNIAPSFHDLHKFYLVFCHSTNRWLITFVKNFLFFFSGHRISWCSSSTNRRIPQHIRIPVSIA